MTDWELALTTALRALAGSSVSEAWVQEMAFYGPDDSGCFTDPQLPFIQANVLELRMAEGQAFQFSCHQDDDRWALWVRTASTDGHLPPDEGQGWFRTRAVPEFPPGRIDDVRIDGGAPSNIQEIRIAIKGREIVFRAGEVYENPDGSLSVCDRDESVLVFLDTESYARQIFNEPVYRLPIP